MLKFIKKNYKDLFLFFSIRIFVENKKTIFKQQRRLQLMVLYGNLIWT